MQNIAELVDLYLSMDTSYALLVSGPWGSGKTHYFKDVILPQIQKKHTVNNASKRYKPVLVSLFGQRSVEDIQTSIFLSLHSILKNKYIQLGASISKGLINGALKLAKIDSFSGVLDNAKPKPKDWIEFDEIVLILDDLERIDKELTFRQLIGFINSLVESQSVKVIIIANRDQIQDEDFNNLKEKTIGNTIHFKPNLKDSIKQIIAHRFAGSPVYEQYLEQKASTIIQLFAPHSSNLRTLIYCLQHFQYIYSATDVQVTAVSLLAEKKQEIFDLLLRFALAIATEYKKGEIDFNNRRELDRELHMSLNELFAEKAFANKKDEEKGGKAFNERFREQYYPQDRYFFFSSIYDFMTGMGKLNEEDLQENLKIYYHIVDNKVSPQQSLLETLQHPQVYNYSDQEYLKATRELLDYADKGYYDLYNYTAIFYYATRFKNPLALSRQRLTNRLIKGMRKGKNRYQHIHNLDLHFNITTDDPDLAYHQQLITEAQKINEQLKSEETIADGKRKQDEFFADPTSFITEVLQPNSRLSQTAFLQYFDAKQFYLFAQKVENAILVKIVYFFYHRRTKGFPDHLKEEKPFIDQLITLFESHPKKWEGKGITAFIQQDLYSNLIKYQRLLTDGHY